MKGVCSLLVDAASAVADIRALIWRISRSSVDGCITFSFDLGPTTRFLILVHRKSAGHRNRKCCLRQIARASVRKGKPAHLSEPGQAIFPVQHVDEVPHDRLPCLITGSHYDDIVSRFFPPPKKWLRRKRGIFHGR
jgi:hypothetical protein